MGSYRSPLHSQRPPAPNPVSHVVPRKDTCGWQHPGALSHASRFFTSGFRRVRGPTVPPTLEKMRYRGDTRVKKCLSTIAVIAALYVGWIQLDGGFDSPTPSAPSSETLADAIRYQRNRVQVTGAGIVTRILPDDNDGSRHQRFILSLAPGQTLLVAHNIDVAPRVASLERGDSVSFYGVCEWNAQGGLIHWTHHDPDGQHAAGWLKHEGRTYQ